MQEKRKNISQVKQRILQFVEIMNIKKEKFYQETSLCGANFRGKSAESELSCDKIAIILRVYDDLNPDWLLLGKGEMLRSEQEQQQTPQKENNLPDDYIPQLIASQHKYIHALESEIKQLKEQIEQLEK